VLFAAAVAAALLALAVSRRLHRGYVAALEDSLRSGVLRLDLADVRDSTTLLTLARTGGIAPDALRAELAQLRREARRAPEADDVPALVARLRGGDAEDIRRALRQPAIGDPALVGHLVPLLARNDVFLDVLRALRRAAPRATGQLLDALLDPAQPLAVRRRLPRVLRGTASQRAADGLVLALADRSFEVRRQAALTLVRITERAPELRVPPAAVHAAVLQELARGAADWAEEGDLDVPDDAGQAPDRPRTPAERGLAHVFALLSLAVEREPLRIAYWALLGEDAGLRGTAFEYLENVLPEDVRRALRAHLGARPASSGREAAQARRDLLRAGDTAGVSREALKRLVPRR
jgi:hypothetical protein